MNVIVLLWIGLLQQDVLVIPSPDRLHVPDVYVSDIEVTDELEMQEIHVHIIEALMEAGYDVHSARVLAPDERGLWRPLPAHLEQRPAPPPKPQELKSAAGGSAVVRGLGVPGATAAMVRA